jgi:hypothetical protein
VVNGEDLLLQENLRGVPADDITRTILAYIDNLKKEERLNLRRRDGGPQIRIQEFLKRWQEANTDPTAIAVKDLVTKHFPPEDT